MSVLSKASTFYPKRPVEAPLSIKLYDPSDKLFPLIQKIKSETNFMTAK